MKHNTVIVIVLSVCLALVAQTCLADDYPWIQDNPTLKEAICLCYGIGRLDDSDNALPLFEKAAEIGDPVSVMWLARLYFDNRCGFPRDEERAQRMAAGVVDALPTLVEAGNVEAEFLLADANLYGLGKDKNLKAAVKLYRQLAEKGHIFGIEYYAQLMKNGTGIPKNNENAFEWYKKAADKGHISLMYWLSRYYHDDDETESRKWLVKAAQSGSPRAMEELGNIYRDGRGVSKNENEALKWYMKASKYKNRDTAEYIFHLARSNLLAQRTLIQKAEAGNLPAMFYLAMMYFQGYPLEKNEGKAAELGIKVYLESKNDESYLFLSSDALDLLQRLSGIENTTAKRFLISEAEKGDVYVIRTLAEMYEVNDKNKAAELYYKADVMDSNGASIDLTRLARTGNTKALGLLKKLAANGDVSSMVSLGKMNQDGDGVSQNNFEAVKWYRRAADKGNGEAMYSLALMYEDGSGVDRDFNEANRWYIHAAKEGHAGAQEKLKQLGIDWETVPAG